MSMHQFSFGRKVITKSVFDASRKLMLYSISRSFLEEDGSELVGRGKWPCGLLTLGKSTINVPTSNSLYLL